MFKRMAPVAAIALLSGCTLMNGEKYHQATLSAIQASEANITNRMTNLELQLDNQTDYIDSLEDEVTSLKKQVSQLKSISETIKKQTKDIKPEAATIPEPMQVNVGPSHNIILGEVEHVTIDNISQVFDARIDTGAATSSLNAVDIEEFERNGKNWVRFHLAEGEIVVDKDNWIEAPVLRYVKIRQSTNPDTERRAVVELWVKLGSIHEKAQFTLADRTQMSHAILLGREFIRDIALVDVSRKYIHTGSPDNKSKK